MKPFKCIFLNLFVTTISVAGTMTQSLTEQQLIERGHEGYLNRCAGCHGAKADGQGPAAAMLNPKPRNLVEGSFKFRTTPSGNLPTVSDLLRTINQGIPGTAMPPFQDVADAEKLAIVSYIRSLRPEFKETKPERLAITIQEPPQAVFGSKAQLMIAASRGKKYFAQGCVSCHGDSAKGDGPSAEMLVDSYDQPIRPADLTRTSLKSGKTAKDVFKVMTTGLDGSPMPAFADIFDETKRWDIVAYIFYLRGQSVGLYDEKDILK